MCNVLKYRQILKNGALRLPCVCFVFLIYFKPELQRLPLGRAIPMAYCLDLWLPVFFFIIDVVLIRIISGHSRIHQTTSKSLQFYLFSFSSKWSTRLKTVYYVFSLYVFFKLCMCFTFLHSDKIIFLCYCDFQAFFYSKSRQTASVYIWKLDIRLISLNY